MKHISIAALITLAACQQDPNQATFQQNVAQAFAPCNDAEIRYLSGKHNFQAAFEPCGSNGFIRHSWSPDGHYLYFSFVLSHHIMDVAAPDKRVITLPAQLPAGQPAWLSSAQLALPIPPPHGKPEDPWAISVFDREALTVFDYPIAGLTNLDHMTLGDQPRELLFSATEAAVRNIYRINLDQGKPERAWPWLQGPIDHFSYAPSQQMVAVGRGETVTLFRTPAGEEVGRWEGVKHGYLAPEGRWLALEFEGPEVSIFFQRHWDEMSEKAREREKKRALEFEKTIVNGAPTRVRPPSIALVDLESKDQWYFDSFQGDQFQWYPPTPTYFSLRLWGFEEKQLKPNILLGSFFDRTSALQRGEVPLGVHRWADLKK